MPIILDQALYNRIKREADEIYEKPSAYRSGWIVRHYKKEGGRFMTIINHAILLVGSKKIGVILAVKNILFIVLTNAFPKTLH